MISTPKWLSLLTLAFVAGAFVASPELRAYAANTVGSSDIINESILSADIKNGEVKASEIATDAVGAAEIQGVSKLLFGQCKLNSVEASVSVQPGISLQVNCTITGVDGDDSAIATMDDGSTCFHAGRALTITNEVLVYLRNECSTPQTVGSGSNISVMVYDK
jgi:hypothetical protein